MIEFEQFAFAAPPHTATAGFLAACSQLKMKSEEQSHLVYHPPDEDYLGFVLSMVRNPCKWLEIVFEHAWRMHGVPELDVFLELKKESDEDFHEFVRLCLKKNRGGVGRMFDVYKPSSVMKVEDFPWCAVEFFESIGIPRKSLKVLKNLEYLSNLKLCSAEERRAVLASEQKFCDRYEYF